MTRHRTYAFLLLGSAVMVAACGPAARPSSGGDQPRQAPEANQPVNSAPKTIKLAVDASSEPAGGMILIGRGGAVGLENFLMFHSGLTIYDQDSKLGPRLAE